MKKLKVTIVLTVDDDLPIEDITLQSDDVIDGYQLTREGTDIVSVFKMHDATLVSIKPIKEIKP